MAATPRYGFGTTLDTSFDDAVERVIAALKTQGFGVLTEIDVQATLKAKLGVERDRYLILGACNPPLAHRALETEPELGLLLPCNVIVYEQGPAQIRVSVVDPLTMVEAADNPALQPVADEARQRLERVLDALG